MHLIEARELNECLSDMSPPMMTCEDDSWSPDNWMVAVVTASAQLFMQSIVYAEQLREIYPDLLKRLADSNVSIQNHKMTMTGSRHLATKWGASNVSAAKETCSSFSRRRRWRFCCRRSFRAPLFRLQFLPRRSTRS